MGREARRRQHAKRPGEGNPVVNQLMMKIVDPDTVREARRRDGVARVRFSDRTYAIDQHGTLHRERPAVVQITKTDAAPAAS